MCPLCGRELIQPIESHHLKPQTFSSRDKTVHNKSNRIDLHRICHQKIHSTFSEKQLFDFYHTIQRIQQHEHIKKFVKWVAKKPGDYYDKNIDSKSRKSKRKR